MKNDLVVNPFIQLQFANEDRSKFFIVAPKLQNGLLQLEISESKYPHLHELFLDLAQTRFDFIDVEKDLDATERELLFEAGVLVEPENVPDKPLFACFLDDVETEEFAGDASSLIVSPAFRFEPFNFANFLSWAHEKHFSPHQPSVWLKQLVTGIEIGYWLDSNQAETVAKFTAGEKLSIEIEPDFLSKLITCGILATPEMLRESEAEQSEILEKAKIKYQQSKYVVLRELLPAAQMTAMRRFYRQYVNHGFMPFNDLQSNRYYQHNEPLARHFHQNLAGLMSLVIGEEVVPSYVYAASYIDQADLMPHTDRAQCEFSISFQVDYFPEPENHLSPWGLFLMPPGFSADGAFVYDAKNFPAKSETEDKNTAVYLRSGDGLIYKGRELVHYRYALPDGHQSTSLFFHYVPKNFEGLLN
ncbi:MAG: hypothetical protein ABJA66_03435 [Actinomycetota bacterium]